MPVHLDESGKCVVEPDGTTIKCHETHKQALAHMRAINANVEHKTLTIFKDHLGDWNWMGIVTNSWQDREKDVLTTKAHKKFVTAIDSGIYKDFMGKDAPDLWIWHVPVPVGYTKMVAYDERGFLVAAGKGHKGEFYDKVFTALARKEEEQPGYWGMSHGMPVDLIRLSEDEVDFDHNYIIDAYMSEEFSFLPWEKAANLGTGMGSVMIKSKYMDVEKEKEDWFIDTFGEDTVAEFGSRLGEIGQAIDLARTPKKELSMTDSTDAQKETVAEEGLADEVVEESTVEEEATTSEETVTEVASEEKQDSKPSDDEEEDEEDTPPKGKEFVTSKDLENVVAEIVKGVAAPVQALKQEIDELRKELEESRSEIASIRSSEDQRVTKKAADMPQASLSSVIARTIVGQESAQIDYNKERTLHQSGPSEAVSELSGDGLTGIPSIDKLIKEQRSGLQMAYTGGQ